MTYKAFSFRPDLPEFFDAEWYLQAYPDVAAAGANPKKHYRTFGRAEGRMPCFLPTKLRERDQRWGLCNAEDFDHQKQGQNDLANLVYEAISLARSKARAADWQAAWLLLNTDLVRPHLVSGFKEQDHVLLGVEAAIVAGHLSQAERWLDEATRIFGRSNDLVLARANLLAARYGFGGQWQRCLQKLFAHAGLSAPAMYPAITKGTAFDLLGADQSLKAVAGDPLVSVVMPTRNARQWVGTALRSLSAQTWQNLEVLVVHNGSDAATDKIVRDASAKDPRIRLMHAPEAGGTYAARNTGMRAARGEFLTVLDADDWAHPERIASQVETLRRQPDAKACMTDWVRVTPNLRATRWWKDDGLIHPDLSSLMIRRRITETLGFWDHVIAGGDSEYHERILAAYGTQSVVRTHAGFPLGFGRLHPGSLTQQATTHTETQFYGARRDYRMASRRWHRKQRELGFKPLSDAVTKRPFPVPDCLSIAKTNRAADDVIVEAGIYDDTWYMQTYADLRVGDIDGLTHFQEVGEQSGRSPGPFFSPSAYKIAYPNIKGSASYHYATEGKAQGLSPLPVFEGKLSLAKNASHTLLFGHSAEPSLFGAERCLLTLLEQANAEGCIPSVVLPNIRNEMYLDQIRRKCHKLFVIPYGPRFGCVKPHPKTLQSLVRLFQTHHVTSVHQNTLTLDAPLIAGQMAGIRTIVHVHELPDHDPMLCLELGSSAGALRNALLSQADVCIANSRAVADWLNLPEERIAINPPVVDAELMSLAFSPGSPLRVSIVGSLTGRKGLLDIYKIAKRCHSAGSKIIFQLFGPRPEGVLNMGPPNCEFMGYVSSPLKIMMQSDVLLSLSKFSESFGLTVAEALVSGRPVICYDRGTPPDLVRSTQGGVVVASDRPDRVFRILNKWSQSPESLRDISSAARRNSQAFTRIRNNKPIFQPT